MTWLKWYADFAKYYNILDGASVNYTALIDRIDDIFKRYNVKIVADFACGVGNCVIPLAKKGYDITGIDLSKEMLDVARENISREKVSIKLVYGDPRTLIIDKFDAILCLYNYVGHFTKNEFASMLDNFRKNLNPGGLIIFDIFNFNFMKKNFMSDSFIDIARKTDNITAVRFNNNSLDLNNKIMKIEQKTFIQDKKLKEYKHDWQLQIYALDELKDILKDKFEIIDVYGTIFGDNVLSEFRENSECIVILAKAL